MDVGWARGGRGVDAGWARGVRRVGAGWAGRVTAAQWVGQRWEKSEKIKVSQSGREWVRRPERAYAGLIAPKIVA